MKKLLELFQQMNNLFPCQLILVDEEGSILASTNIVKSKQPKITGTPWEISVAKKGVFKLYGTENLHPETLTLLAFMIRQHLTEIASLDKSQGLAHFIKAGQDLLLNKDLKQYLQSIQSFHLIWLETLENENLSEIFQLLVECFIDNPSYTVTLLDDGILLLIEGDYQRDALEEISKLMRNTINAELFIEINMIVSKVLFLIKKLPSYLERLKRILNIGKSFDEGKHIYFSESLSLEEMISLIPMEIRGKIYVEIFQNSGYDEMEEEMHQTARAFLDNNLSMTDTSKNLYIHRNTLVYRLDKIQKLTGLDLRNLQDALLYKICILFKKSL